LQLLSDAEAIAGRVAEPGEVTRAKALFRLNGQLVALGEELAAPAGLGAKEPDPSVDRAWIRGGRVLGLAVSAGLPLQTAAIGTRRLGSGVS